MSWLRAMGLTKLFEEHHCSGLEFYFVTGVKLSDKEIFSSCKLSMVMIRTASEMNVIDVFL